MDELAAGRGASNLSGVVTGQVVNALLDQPIAGCMEEQSVALVAQDLALKASQTHGTMLQEGRGSATLPKSRQSSNSVVAHDDPGLSQVNFASRSVEGEDTPEGFPQDLVLHVVRVRERSHDDHAFRARPPAEDRTPAVD